MRCCCKATTTPISADGSSPSGSELPTEPRSGTSTAGSGGDSAGGLQSRAISTQTANARCSTSAVLGTVLRPLAKELGRRLVDAGTLHAADDIYFLTTEELGRAIRSLVALARLPDGHRQAHYPDGPGLPHYARLAVERRALREARKRLKPPLLIPGPAPWSPLVDDSPDESPANVMRGSAVSPGRISGEACVIPSAEDFGKMRPGTILVCPTTTPAWTQLFPQAIALVTDIGGILAHGSIVAREYGIPAVLGLVNATDRIRDGQTITVDGDKGLVEL